MARQRELPALLLARTWQHGVPHRIPARPVAAAAPGGYDAVQQHLHHDPDTVLTVRYGFNRFPNYSYDVEPGFQSGSLGFSPSLVNQVPKALAQFPYVTMTNLYTLGVSDNNSFYVHASDNFSANISKYMGRHMLKGGFDYRRIKAPATMPTTPAGIHVQRHLHQVRRRYQFWHGRRRPGRHAAGLSFRRARSTLPPSLTDIANYYGLYVQDDFRVSNRLTLKSACAGSTSPVSRKSTTAWW